MRCFTKILHVNVFIVNIIVFCCSHDAVIFLLELWKRYVDFDKCIITCTLNYKLLNC